MTPDPKEVEKAAKELCALAAEKARSFGAMGFALGADAEEAFATFLTKLLAAQEPSLQARLAEKEAEVERLKAESRTSCHGPFASEKGLVGAGPCRSGGDVRPAKDLYRCRDCGLYFCPPCADIHFGTREEREREKAGLKDAKEAAERQVAALREAAKKVQCGCSISQSESGHDVDCWWPEFNEAIDSTAATAEAHDARVRAWAFEEVADMLERRSTDGYFANEMAKMALVEWVRGFSRDEKEKLAAERAKAEDSNNGGGR